ncbi:MAG: hypothetical protein QM758_06100 [Armatimonas sp.]
MKNLTTLLTIALAIWWTFLWGIVATVAITGMLVPDPGSIISFRTSWWVVGGVVTTGLLGIWLLWAALRSFAGTVALTVVTLAVLAASFWSPAGIGSVAVLMCPTLLLLPLLWYRHRISLAR